MTSSAPLLHVRVGRIVSGHDTHPLVASLYAGDDCVSDTVHHRDMRAVRAYYNGFIRGLTATGAVRYHDTVIELDRIGSWPYKLIDCRVPINPKYVLADGIDPMHD